MVDRQQIAPVVFGQKPGTAERESSQKGYGNKVSIHAPESIIGK
jgi:hypothetical protein